MNAVRCSRDGSTRVRPASHREPDACVSAASSAPNSCSRASTIGSGSYRTLGIPHMRLETRPSEVYKALPDPVEGSLDPLLYFSGVPGGRLHREGEAFNDRHDSPVGRRVIAHPDPFELQTAQHCQRNRSRVQVVTDTLFRRPPIARQKVLGFQHHLDAAILLIAERLVRRRRIGERNAMGDDERRIDRARIRFSPAMVSYSAARGSGPS